MDGGVDGGDHRHLHVTGRPRALSGWGRYPVATCVFHRPANTPAASALVGTLPSVIARGNARSYGDASLNLDAVVETRGLDRMLALDEAAGTVVCEGGVLLAELIDALLPRGLFPAVVPGTRLVTIGGMIASDVHGKNHHGAGSFAEHVDWIDLDIGGTVLRCSRTEHDDLFAATCGGMGLTGVILRAQLRLARVESSLVRQRTIRAPNLSAALAALEGSLGWTYSVAWIDCLARGAALGRSAVLLGEHAPVPDLPASRRIAPFARPRRRTRRLPVDLPAFALGRSAVRLFNQAYYRAQRPGDRLVGLDPYFFPLDAILDWNRAYGRRGFVQYQCVLPLAESERGLGRLLELISAEGQASFLAVLKRLGPASFGLLSFPMEGYTLALDFPATPASLTLLDRLDAIVAEHGGRVYLAKDARAAPSAIAGGYPNLPLFRDVRRRYGLDERFSSLLSRRLEL